MNQLLFEKDGNLKKSAIFRRKCLHHQMQKMNLSTFQEEDLSISEPNSAQSYRMKLLQNEVEDIEKTFDEIERRHGELARSMIYECYVEGIKQRELSEVYGIPLRTLQRRFQEWLAFLDQVNADDSL